MSVVLKEVTLYKSLLRSKKLVVYCEPDKNNKVNGVSFKVVNNGLLNTKVECDKKMIMSPTGKRFSIDEIELEYFEDAELIVVDVPSKDFKGFRIYFGYNETITSKFID